VKQYVPYQQPKNKGRVNIKFVYSRPPFNGRLQSTIINVTVKHKDCPFALTEALSISSFSEQSAASLLTLELTGVGLVHAMI